MKMKNRIKKTLSNQKGFIQSLIPSVFKSKAGSSKGAKTEELETLCDKPEPVAGPSNLIRDDLQTVPSVRSEKAKTLVEECGNSTAETFLSSQTSSQDEFPENFHAFQSNPETPICSDVLEIDTHEDELLQSIPDDSEQTFLSEKIEHEANEDRLLMPPPTKPPLPPYSYQGRPFLGGYSTQSCPALPHGSLIGKLVTSKERRHLRRSVSANSTPKNYLVTKCKVDVSCKSATPELRKLLLLSSREIRQKIFPSTSPSTSVAQNDATAYKPVETITSPTETSSFSESFSHCGSPTAEHSYSKSQPSSPLPEKLDIDQGTRSPSLNIVEKLPPFACLQASLKPRCGTSQLSFPRHHVFMEVSNEKSSPTSTAEESQLPMSMRIPAQRYSSLYLHLQNTPRSKRQPLMQHLQTLGGSFSSSSDEVVNEPLNLKPQATDPIGLALAQEFQKTFDKPLTTERLNYMMTEPYGTNRDTWLQAAIAVMVTVLNSKNKTEWTPFHCFDLLMCSAKWIVGGAVHVDLEEATYTGLVVLERSFFPPHTLIGLEEEVVPQGRPTDIPSSSKGGGCIYVICPPTFVFPFAQWRSLMLQLIKLNYQDNSKALAVYRRLTQLAAFL